jgi:hypothetical protein
MAFAAPRSGPTRAPEVRAFSPGLFTSTTKAINAELSNRRWQTLLIPV